MAPRFSSDLDALTVLRLDRGDDESAPFVLCRGVITARDPARQLTAKEWEAIDYLFNEWDYAFERQGG